MILTGIVLFFILEANVEKGIMSNVANFGYIGMNNAIQSAKSTFRNLNSDAGVNIINQPNNNNEGWTYEGMNFVENNEEALAEAIEDYVYGPPSIHVDPQNYPFLLVYGSYAGVSQSSIRYLGFSNNVNRPFSMVNSNYSIAFVQSIRELCNDFNPPKNFTSVLNMVTPHELIHQIGNVWEHSNHANTQPLCVLNSGSFFTLYTNFFDQLTTQYVICSNHISNLRTGVGGDLNIFVNKQGSLPVNSKNNNFAFDNHSLADNNPAVNISLPKKTYKKFEPIELEFEWVNTKNSQDSIWALFNSLQFIKYVFTDKNDNRIDRHSNKGLNIMMSDPSYILQPGDTLKRSMTINHFGQFYSDFNDGWYFHNAGYFPVGKYKVYAIIDEDLHKKYDIPIITNEIEFEITEIDETDKKVLELVKQKKYEDALKIYPSNYYKEYLMYFNVDKYFIDLLKTEMDNKRYDDKDKLIDKYKEFFNSYPNSLYNLNYTFISNYLSLNSSNINDVLHKKNELINSYPGTILEYVLKDMLKRNKFAKIKPRK